MCIGDIGDIGGPENKMSHKLREIIMESSFPDICLRPDAGGGCSGIP